MSFLDLSKQKCMVKVSAHVPNIITKELAISSIGGKRKARLSSNFLPLMGFEAGNRHNVIPIGEFGGFKIQFDSNGAQKVYERSYPKRKNNPFETVIEIGSQSLLDLSIPAYTERLHYTMRRGEIVVMPLANRTFSIRKKLKIEKNPFIAMAALTSGIDIRCLIDTGFSIDSVLEWRPREKRDHRDLTETGALNCLVNSKPRLLINEDISTVDMARVKYLMNDAPQIAVLHISLQCDDFSTVKAGKFKQQSVDDLTTSKDLFYDALRLVETVQPACVVVEQVEGFSTSAEGEIFKIKLRKWGYHVTEGVLSAPEYGGITRRTRYYLVASVFPSMTLPKPSAPSTDFLWPLIEPYLDTCRDVSHTKSLHDGLELGRARLITNESIVAPTVLKSQPRQAKDSVFIKMPDGTYRLPSLELVQRLQGIPQSVSVDSVSSEQAFEILGQSIDWPMHHAVMKSVYDHIADNVGAFNCTNLKANNMEIN